MMPAGGRPVGSRRRSRPAAIIGAGGHPAVQGHGHPPQRFVGLGRAFVGGSRQAAIAPVASINGTKTPPALAVLSQASAAASLA